jgi:hypothetical protein
MSALRIGFLGVSLLALGLKFFTFEVMLKDDPTVSLVLRSNPSLENRAFLDDSSQLAGAVVLAEDENSFVGEGLYGWVVSMGWWLLPFLTVLVWVGPRLRRQAARP